MVPTAQTLPAPQPADAGWHFVDWGCELLGTLLLVLGGTTAVVAGFASASPLAHHLHGTHLRLLVVGFFFAGSGAAVTISPIGRRSGAHLNPAVTLAFFLKRHVSWHDLIGYVVAQLTGATAGAGLAVAIWRRHDSSPPVHYAITTPGHGVSVLTALVVEAAMTASLVLVIFGMLSSPRTARWTPLAVWVLVTVLVWRVATITGTSLNPARSLGPDWVAGYSTDAWVYVVAPLAGAALAVAGWDATTSRRVLTAKLFHDSRYASVLKTRLPAMPAGAAKNPDAPSKPVEAHQLLVAAQAGERSTT
jgi:aquaporin Z